MGNKKTDPEDKRLEELKARAAFRCAKLNESAMSAVRIEEDEDRVKISLISKMKTEMRSWSLSKAEKSYYEDANQIVEELFAGYALPLEGKLAPPSEEQLDAFEQASRLGHGQAEKAVYTGLNRALAIFDLLEIPLGAYAVYLAIALLSGRVLGVGAFTDTPEGRALQVLMLVVIPVILLLCGALKIITGASGFAAVILKKSVGLRILSVSHIFLCIFGSLPFAVGLITNFLSTSLSDTMASFFRIFLNAGLIVLMIGYHYCIRCCLNHAYCYLGSGKLSYTSIKRSAGWMGLGCFVCLCGYLALFTFLYALAGARFPGFGAIVKEYPFVIAYLSFYLIKHVLMIVAIRKYTKLVTLH